MQDEKNRNHKKNTDKELSGNQEEYHFLREVIKEKPIDKRKILWRVGGIMAGAVLFGVVAAFTFARVLPLIMPEEKNDKVDITEETQQTSIAPQPIEEPVDQEEKKAEKEKADLEDFRNVYQLAVEMAKTPEKALVTVQGITNDVDWMNNSYENEQQISGFLVADNEKSYFVVTEYRVVENVDRILVTFADGTTVDANFQKRDQGTGLAVLKIAKDEVKEETRAAIEVAELGNSTLIQRGELVMAVGSPAGYNGSISCGMVTSSSNIRYTLDNEYHLLTTDIMGDKEGSGILVSMEGKVVGVIVQSFSMTDDKGVVTALPISEIRSVIERLSNNEETMYLGVRGQNIASDLAQKTGIPKGIFVNAVDEDSPAMEAGLQNGDVIVKVGETSVETLSQLRKAMDRCKPDQKIKVAAMRKGAEGYVEIVFDVTVGAI
ncbi:MAG: S1C family serine protease [Oliverpabstia sp.]